MKKVHRLVIRSPYYEWACLTPIHLEFGEDFGDRVTYSRKGVTCKKCLAIMDKCAARHKRVA